MRHILYAIMILGSLIQGSYAVENNIINFKVSSPYQSLSNQATQLLESHRSSLATEFFGEELAPWDKPCLVNISLDPNVKFSGGGTSFNTNPDNDPTPLDSHGHLAHSFVMNLTIKSDLSDLDDVLKHECLHTVLHSKFGRLSNRWADEGTCTSVEKNPRLFPVLKRSLQTNQGIPIASLLTSTEYPGADENGLATANSISFYAHADSQIRFLKQHAGSKYLAYFLSVGNDKGFPYALHHCYGYKPADFQESWLSWVKSGSPRNSHINDYVDESVIGPKTLDSKDLESDELVSVSRSEKPYKVGFG